MQFGAPLREQLDLVTEAAHLDAFSRNFRHWTGVSFPQVGARVGWRLCWCLVTSETLVMRSSWPPRPAVPNTPRCVCLPSTTRMHTARPVPMRALILTSPCLPVHTRCCPLQPADAPLVSSEVLVETFEEGELVST